jgi:predicted AlkP superfamily phosphohydrolase/phosphomutase
MVCAAAVLASCATPRSEQPNARLRPCPILLVGVDGLEWSVLAPLLNAGKLPVMASLMEQGTFGYLESMEPTHSPVIWTSIATGKRAEKHGIYGFTYDIIVNGRRETNVYTSGHRRTKAFWNILSDHGDRVDLFGWWITYPAEPITGVLVSQTNTVGPADASLSILKGTVVPGVEGQVHPPELQPSVMEILAEVDASLADISAEMLGGPVQPPTPLDEQLWKQSLWALRADATYLRVAKAVLEDTGFPGFMGIYFGGPDVVGHRFWRHAHPEAYRHPPSAEQIASLGRIIDDYYVWVDRAIGELLQLAPENVGVMIVSDHGMKPIHTDRIFRLEDAPIDRNSGGHDGAPPGVLIASRGCFRSRPPGERTIRDFDLTSLPRVGSVLDITPTLLALKGIPRAADMDGAPLAELIQAAVAEKVVPTHDTPEWLATRRARMRDAMHQSERLEQLRSLGYIQ